MKSIEEGIKREGTFFSVIIAKLTVKCMFSDKNKFAVDFENLIFFEMSEANFEKHKL